MRLLVCADYMSVVHMPREVSHSCIPHMAKSPLMKLAIKLDCYNQMGPFLNDGLEMPFSAFDVGLMADFNSL